MMKLTPDHPQRPAPAAYAVRAAPAVARLAGWLVLAFVCGAWAGPKGASDPAGQDMAGPDNLFQLTNVWTLHLTFTPDEWEAMEPKGDAASFGPGGFGRRGFGFGGRRGGPPGLALSRMLAPAFISEGASNSVGHLSKQEFTGLAQKWFKAWDTDKTGKLDADKIRAGLDKTLAPFASRARPDGGMRLQGPEGKRNGLASAMGIEFTYSHADLDFEGRQFKDVAVRYKGNGTYMQSRGALKRSLKIDLKKYSQGRKLGGMTKLNLHSNVTDASWMNEPLSHTLYRDAGVPAPHTAYARLFVTVPGVYARQYVGLYSLVEEVDKHFAGRYLGGAEGALFKPVTPALFEDLGDTWPAYNQTYDPKTSLTARQSARVIEFAKFVSYADDTQFAARVGTYIDLQEFARYMAVMVWLSDLDGLLGPGQNFYMYLHPKTGLFQFIAWDQDHSFGQFGMRGTQEQRENLSINKPWDGQNRFLERVFKVTAFKELYLARLKEFSETLFNPGRFARQVDLVAAAIRPAVKEESEFKLARFDSAVAGETLAGGYDRFRGGGIKPIKPFAEIRTQSVTDQLAGKSAGENLEERGFRGRGRGRGGLDNLAPGAWLGGVFLQAMDQNEDSVVTADEFTRTFAKWFDSWDTDKSGYLTQARLRAGIEKDLSPFRDSERE